MTLSQNHLAGRVVALHAVGDVAVKRELMEALGIVEPGEREVAPDLPPVEIEWVGWKRRDEDAEGQSLGFARNRREPPPMDRSAVPAGLRDLQPLVEPISGPVPEAPVVEEPVVEAPVVEEPVAEKAPAEPPTEKPRRRQGRPPLPIDHGTIGGYRAHLRRGIPACEDCLAAERTRVRNRRPKPPVQDHGTYAAWRRHNKAREEACEPCLEAARAYWRKCNVGRKRRAAEPAPEPTTTGPVTVEVSPPEAAREIAAVLNDWIQEARIARSPTVRRAALRTAAALVQFRIAVEELDRVQRNSATHLGPQKESA